MCVCVCDRLSQSTNVSEFTPTAGAAGWAVTVLHHAPPKWGHQTAEEDANEGRGWRSPCASTRTSLWRASRRSLLVRRKH